MASRVGDLDLVELEKVTTQKNKDDTKLCVTQLAEKKQNEKMVAEERAVRKVAQEAAEQKKATEVAATTQTVETTTIQAEEGQAASLGQEAKGTKIEKESMDLGTTSTQLKWSCIVERLGPRKKVKASKLAINPINLIEGDLHEIGKTVYDVTSEVI